MEGAPSDNLGIVFNQALHQALLLGNSLFTGCRLLGALEGLQSVYVGQDVLEGDQLCYHLPHHPTQDVVIVKHNTHLPTAHLSVEQVNDDKVNLKEDKIKNE